MSRTQGVAFWLLLTLWSSTAVSQTPLGPSVAGFNASSANRPSSPGTCCAGIARVRRLLTSQEESKRIAGTLLVGARNDDAAWQLLNEIVTTTQVERTPAEDLALARVVAPNVRKSLVRPIVTHLVYATSARLDPEQPLRLLAMQICLAALAWSQSPEGLAELGRMLKRDGAIAESSIEALLLYPPEPFDRLFAPTVARTAAWARLLGFSKRTASIPILRQVLLDGPEDRQIAAAEALLRLGDRGMDPLVQRWARDPRTPEAFKRFAGNATQEPGSPRPLGKQGSWTLPAESKAILGWVRSPDHVAARLVESHDVTERPLLLTALLLAKFGPGNAPEISAAWLRARLVEKDSRLGFAAAAMLAKLEPSLLMPSLEQRDATVERAVAWSLPYLEPTSPLLEAAAAILKREDPTHGSSLLCSGLTHDRLRQAMPTDWVLAMAHADGACAPLAAETLATRDSVELREALRSLLWAPHPSMRAAIARGLARSLDPSAAGLLVARFAVEDEVRVRRAIVRSLGRRDSGLGRQVLRDAARFDPDPLVRSFALRGINRDPLEALPGDPLGFGLGAMKTASDPNALWDDARLAGVAPVVLSVPSSVGASVDRLVIAIVSGPDGGSMPVVPDPAGHILLPVAAPTLLVEGYAVSGNPPRKIAN
jgi:hypothetical protein